MNKKVIIHGCLLGGLIVYTSLVWGNFKDEEMKREKAMGEDRWGTDVSGSRAETAEGMIRVAVPLLATTIYGAALAIIYGLPAVVGRVTEEMLGSTAEVDDDPLDEARAAAAAGEYTDAIALFHEVLMNEPWNRVSLLEIVRIQRDHLKSPVLAASSLEEGLKGFEWAPDDRAFLMFRMAEIYEDDLDDLEKAKEVLREVVVKLEGTRHAGNAAHKLRQMESS